MSAEPDEQLVATDLADLAEVPLSELGERDDDATETLRRVTPADGSRLLVAASFNSAI